MVKQSPQILVSKGKAITAIRERPGRTALVKTVGAGIAC